jgi:hypothetical protein
MPRLTLICDDDDAAAIHAAVKAAIAEERERCAQLAEAVDHRAADFNSDTVAHHIAAAIRSGAPTQP